MQHAHHSKNDALRWALTFTFTFTFMLVRAARVHAAALGGTAGPHGGREAAPRARRQRQPAHGRLGTSTAPARSPAQTAQYYITVLQQYALPIQHCFYLYGTLSSLHFSPLLSSFFSEARTRSAFERILLVGAGPGRAEPLLTSHSPLVILARAIGNV